MPFARFPDWGACVLEQKNLGHDSDSANKICGEIKERAEKGALLKAQTEGLELLSKAGEDDIVLGGYASWAIEDDDGDFFTAEAQSKALERFFKQKPEYQIITVNHGRSSVGEVPIGKPLLKYMDKAGKEYFSHVNEAGTFLITQMRNDTLTATRHYREKARQGQLNGYSVNAFPLKKDPSDPHRILDMEYSVITVTEKGVMKPRNPRARDVAVLSKAATQFLTEKPCLNDEETILRKYGFNKS